MSRPKKPINWDIVKKKMEAGCSAKEIAGAIPIDISNFYDRFKEEFGHPFANYADELYSVGDGNIKFAQYMKALSGNIPMLTLLGRERLSQGKEQEKQSPFEDILALRHENMILKAEINTLKEPVNYEKETA
jgi:hypothetical protein